MSGQDRLDAITEKAECDCGWIDPYETAKDILAVADAPILALIEAAEARHGSMYCKVTTYELRQALGVDVTNWPNP